RVHQRPGEAARGLDGGERDDGERDVEPAQHVTHRRVLPLRGNAEREQVEVAEDPAHHEGQHHEADGPTDGDRVALHEHHEALACRLTKRSTGQKRPTETSPKPLAHASTESHPRGSVSDLSTW